jgi:pyruvate/2-oxoglutarate dehydrogenase complex dihydrolipoamide dehydrogenase (E3) component
MPPSSAQARPGGRRAGARRVAPAPGRGTAPNTGRLDLAEAGIACDDKGFIRVNPRLETTAPVVSALTDVEGGPQFTHISYDDFRVIRTNLLQDGRACVTDRLVPYTVFIDPQLGRICLSEREAKRQCKPVRWPGCA